MMADLSDKDFKTIAIKMLSELKEVVEKAKKTMYEENGNINKEKSLKINQKEILELKS